MEKCTSKFISTELVLKWSRLQIQKDKKRLIHFENCSSVYRLKKQVLFKTLFEIFSVKRTLRPTTYTYFQKPTLLAYFL